jgi:hypothetical protein
LSTLALGISPGIDDVAPTDGELALQGIRLMDELLSGHEPRIRLGIEIVIG